MSKLETSLAVYCQLLPHTHHCIRYILASRLRHYFFYVFHNFRRLKRAFHVCL
ncbi:unnamed protein product [Larinioides sclopetarius]|uniref:Uncharacterized protein n=1 Tax=Larinioides sclopetarius TaxID=280406 RepID=A0AAV1YSS8_9ARAC